MKGTFLKYHGGKSRLADWIVGWMPPHSLYVEPFGGGGSVLLRKRTAKSEIYNDLDGELFNLFRIVRERGDELARLVELTPYSRDEMKLAYLPAKCEMEKARRFFVRAWMAITTTNIHDPSGFRAAINSDDYCSQFLTWSRAHETILQVRKRLARVGIENCNAFQLFDRYDLPETLWYLDPPYLNHTRSQKSVKRGYRHNLDDQDHQNLLEKAKTLSGKVMISGYATPLYTDVLKDWHMETTKTHDDNNKPRIECLWMNWHGGKQLTLQLKKPTSNSTTNSAEPVATVKAFAKSPGGVEVSVARKK